MTSHDIVSYNSNMSKRFNQLVDLHLGTVFLKII